LLNMLIAVHSAAAVEKAVARSALSASIKAAMHMP
jgi:hypothetical protein